MKRLTKFIALLTLVILLPVVANSDSPITSTDFYKAYMDIPMVKKARERRVLNEDMAGFLSSPENSIDVKAAVINALGWNIRGNVNAILYKKYLTQFYGKEITNRKMYHLSADEIFCLGYLKAMDDYFHPEKALPLLRKARRQNKKSYTVAMILALTESQVAMANDWCKVWRKVDKVFQNDKLTKELRPYAIEIIYEYMILYKEECVEK